jgi:hypothetical protein
VVAMMQSWVAALFKSSGRPEPLPANRSGRLGLGLPVKVGDADSVGVDDPVPFAADHHGGAEDDMLAVFGLRALAAFGAGR